MLLNDLSFSDFLNASLFKKLFSGLN